MRARGVAERRRRPARRQGRFNHLQPLRATRGCGPPGAQAPAAPAGPPGAARRAAWPRLRGAGRGQREGPGQRRPASTGASEAQRPARRRRALGSRLPRRHPPMEPSLTRAIGIQQQRRALGVAVLCRQLHRRLPVLVGQGQRGRRRARLAAAPHPADQQPHAGGVACGRPSRVCTFHVSHLEGAPAQAPQWLLSSVRSAPTRTCFRRKVQRQALVAVLGPGRGALLQQALSGGGCGRGGAGSGGQGVSRCWLGQASCLLQPAQPASWAGSGSFVWGGGPLPPSPCPLLQAQKSGLQPMESGASTTPGGASSMKRASMSRAPAPAGGGGKGQEGE